jgi:malonyl CoA-acyl carrier protein transacylase/acyl carrier protein
MGADLAVFRPEAMAAWELAARLCSGGPRLQDVVFPLPLGPEGPAQAQATLQRTEWAQPALGAAALAALRVLAVAGIVPHLVAGHSFGELVALHAAGVLTDEDLLRAARARGEAMAAAAKVLGAMTAVSHPAEAVRRLLGDGPTDVVFANHNSPEQVVLSGPVAVIEQAEKRLDEAGVRFIRLPVATAFHSPVVAEAVGAFGAFLREVPFAAARLPVIAGSTAAPYPERPADARQLLAGQLAEPVRFADQVETLYRLGARTFVEVGAGCVLTGLVGACLRGRPHRALAVDQKGTHGVTALWHLLSRLAVAGVPVRWTELWEGYALPTDPAPANQTRPTVQLTGAQYQKPYPLSGGEALSRSTPAAPGPTLPAAPVLAPIRTDHHPEVSVNSLPHHHPDHHLSTNGRCHVPPVQEEVAELGDTNALPECEAAPAVDAGSLIRQVTRTQRRFQEHMLQGHQDFLRTMETLARFGSGAERAETMPDRPVARQGRWASPPRAETLPRRKVATMPTRNGAPFRSIEKEYSSTPTTVAEAPAPAPSQPADSPAPAMTAALVTELMLETVTEKTGYPRAILGLEMELDGDLGIDSIRRVEILSALQGRLPGLPELPLDRLATLKTLGAIADFITSKLDPAAGALPLAAPPTPRAEKEARPLHDDPAPAAALTVARVAEVVLDTVAEKTGYTRELIGQDRDLEADLGIDSIKRVEILSALNDRLPGLPEIAANQMISLSTPGKIIAFIENALHARSGPPSLPRGESSPSLPAEPPQPRSAQRAVLRIEEKAAAGFVSPGLMAGGLVGITNDGQGVAAALATELESNGLKAAVVTPGEPVEDLSALVVLEGLRPFDSEAGAAACHKKAFHAVRWAGATLSQCGGLLVTVQDTGGTFGLHEPAPGVRAWSGGLPALAKTAAAEWPTLTARAIDCATGERPAPEIARALARELLTGGAEAEVGLTADGRRWAPHAVAGEVPPGTGTLAKGDVVLAVGGARGVTAACLEELAKRRPLRIALTGRTSLEDEPAACAGAVDEPALINALLTEAKKRGQALTPAEARSQAGRILATREVRTTLARLQAAGSEARYLTVDTRDAATMTASVAELRREWGAVRAVVFAAGTLADKLIAEKTEAQFDAVFSTKVDGLANVLAATAGDPLVLLALFSSIASRSGNRGQCDYAMANEVLNLVALAEASRRDGCLVRSFCWGPWEGGMVTPALRRHFETHGIPLLSVPVGARMFADELLAPPGGDEIVLLGSSLGPPSRAEASRSYTTLAGARTLPFLADHAVKNAPVVPAALVMEWFARAVNEAFPGRRLAELERLRVVRGIRLPDFERQDLPLTVLWSPGSDANAVHLELRDPAGQVRYAAEGRLAGADEVVAPPSFTPATAADPWPWTEDEAYAGPLFHGPRFRAVVALGSMGEEGGSGRLVGTTVLGWPGGPYTTDPAALDGCLQLAFLWGCHYLGRRSLPAALGRVVWCRPGVETGRLSCSFRAARGRDGLSADILLTAAEGAAVLYLGGVELYALSPAQLVSV